MKRNTYTGYVKNRRNALMAKGWQHYLLLCPPELVIELKMTAAKFKALHPEAYGTSKCRKAKI